MLNMKNWVFLIFFFTFVAIGQDIEETTLIETSFLYGNVIPHSEDLHHLVTGHPEGILFSVSKQTFGKKEWHKAFNYPDYGAYFLYQDFKNQFIGKSYTIGLHYNFYFLNRNVQLKVGKGFSLVSNPYDKVENSKNRAFGSKIQANINLGLAYKKDYLFENFGIHTGLLFTHNSNGRFKSPNSGVNTYSFQLGLNYNLKEYKDIKLDTIGKLKSYVEPLHYNFVLRSGMNESSVIGSGQKAFYHFATYADKRIGRKSAIQFGTELFITPSIKNFIVFQSVAFPEKKVKPTTDFKRMGVFVGHELLINKISLETQLGYYIYRPFKHDIPMYTRLGTKYYIHKNIFANLSLKTHLSKAEAVEFGVGIRL